MQSSFQKFLTKNKRNSEIKLEKKKRFLEDKLRNVIFQLHDLNIQERDLILKNGDASKKRKQRPIGGNI